MPTVGRERVDPSLLDARDWLTADEVMVPETPRAAPEAGAARCVASSGA
ncbi:MAG: hypothetical protein M0035_05435 [Actinomycetota bacterium]|nr:hypothetical protein [Actinomycetota bacterium]